ncbi:MAG: hypothetical protein IJC19_09310 [Clostridia bacterium]|nr:hypothetical protein [Clostridia bacterium]
MAVFSPSHDGRGCGKAHRAAPLIGDLMQTGLRDSKGVRIVDDDARCSVCETISRRA